MARSWVLAALAAHLLVLASAAHLSDAEEKDRYRLEEEPSRRRIEREVSAPAKISCELSPWGPWSSCQPCQGIKHRSRSVVHFGQFGGRTCTDILSDEQRCPITGNCEEEPVDCENNFQCGDGHCINRRLKCNDDNDCGDFSDEDDCETVRPTCSKALETLEVGRTAGSGMNILGMKTRRNPFDNNLYNGRCESVYDGHRRARIRIPWNINTFIYETHAQQVLSTEMYESSTEVVKTIFVETTSKFNIGLSLKLNKLVNVSAGVQFSTDNSKSYSTLLSYLQSEKYEYFRVKGQVQMANFNIRRHHYELDRDFVTDLKALPTEYDKGVYFNILEDYGTHYTSSAVLGGDYQLVYVLDTSEMRKRSVTSEQVKNCLGFSANLNVQLNLKNGKIEIPLDVNTENCKNVSQGTTETAKTNRLIKDVVSFVAGGDIAFLTKLNVLLSERNKLIDASVYADWASSLINSPVLLKPKLIPIHTLVPLSMNESVVIRRNLERATHDYEAEFSVCKCQPCMNGGTVVLLDGQCHCLCTLTFHGMACQIPKARHEERAGYTDGQWDCWSSWRPCTDGQQRRSRQCRGRQGDGAECLGESTDITHC